MTDSVDDSCLLLLASQDTVFVLRTPVDAGQTLRIGGQPCIMEKTLAIGHKIARVAMAEGTQVIKYGASIGRTSQSIAVGDHVHVHNLVSDYTPTYALDQE